MKINNDTNYQNNMSHRFQGTGLNKAVKKRLLPIAITAAAIIGAKACEIQDMLVKQDKQPVKTEQTTPFNTSELILSVLPLSIIADPNKKSIKGRTELMRAVIDDNINKFKNLLEMEEIDPNIQDNGGNTALIWAAYNNNLNFGKAILAHKKTDPNLQDNDGNTALIWAAYNNNLDFVKAILAHKKTDPNIKDSHGNTALHYAIYNNNIVMIETICKSENFDVNVSLDTLARNNTRIFAENLIKKRKHEQEEKQREIKAGLTLLRTYFDRKFKFKTEDYYNVTPYLRALENDIPQNGQEILFNEKQDNDEDSLLCKFVSSVTLCEDNKKEYQEILDKLDKLDINYDQTDKAGFSVFDHIMNSENILLLKHVIKKGAKFTYNPNLDLAYKNIEDKEFKALLDEHKYELVEFKDVADARKSQDTEAIQSVQAQMASPFFNINRFM